MLIKNFRLFGSCILLAIVIGWGMNSNRVPVKHNHARAIEGSQNLSTSVRPMAIANLNQAQTLKTVTPPVPQPLPMPIPLPPPPPPPVSQWQGDVQAYTTTPGQVPVLSNIPTDRPVIFLGIDDGLIKSPEAQSWLLNHKLPFTLFLDNADASADYDYFKPLQDAGMTIEDHTMTHTDLTTLNLDKQKQEICGAADQYTAVYGHRPTLFRPPYGAYNEITRQAASDCGMKAIIIWHAKANGGSIQFQDGNTHFLPGDIVLMHFRHEFLQDMQAFTDQVQKDGLQVGRLEDWIQ